MQKDTNIIEIAEEVFTLPTLEQVLKYLDHSYYLDEVNQGDKFSNEELASAFQSKEWYSLEATDGDNYEAIKFAIQTLKDETLSPLFDDNDESMEEFFDDNDEEIRDAIHERNQSDPTGDLLKNSGNLPLRMTVTSNFEVSDTKFYPMEYDGYFRDLLDFLQINPQDAKKELLRYDYKVVGRWPNKPKRNPIVNFDKKFIEELNNNSGNSSRWVFLAEIDIKKWLNADSKVVTVPKGTQCGLFDNWAGSGSVIECETVRSFTTTLPVQQYGKSKYDTLGTSPDVPQKDGGNGYCTSEVFGGGCFDYAELTTSP